MMDYKKEVIQSAINGMVQGGFMTLLEAQVYEALFARIYDCGYNECRRNIEEQLYRE